MEAWKQTNVYLVRSEQNHHWGFLSNTNDAIGPSTERKTRPLFQIRQNYYSPYTYRPSAGLLFRSIAHGLPDSTLDHMKMLNIV